MVAELKSMELIVAVQLLFGQPPSLPVIAAGGDVVTLKGTFPFLSGLVVGMNCPPETSTDPGFCPGASLPPGLVQVTSGTTLASSWTNVLKLPRPARAPDALSVVGVGWLNVGLFWPLKCGLAAIAGTAVRAATMRPNTTIIPILLNIEVFLLYLVGLYCSLRTGECLRHCLRAVECLFAGAGRSCVCPYIAKQASGPLSLVIASYASLPSSPPFLFSLSLSQNKKPTSKD